jgi:hypothetical protein
MRCKHLLFGRHALQTLAVRAVLDGMLLYGIYLQNRLQLLSIGHVECGKGVAPVV